MCVHLRVISKGWEEDSTPALCTDDGEDDSSCCPQQSKGQVDSPAELSESFGRTSNAAGRQEKQMKGEMGRADACSHCRINAAWAATISRRAMHKF